MRTIPDLHLLQAEVADLRAKTDRLEARLLGPSTDPVDDRGLAGLYMDACTTPMDSAETARHWERHFLRLSTGDMIRMGRMAHDPTPWKPFLQLVDYYIDRGYPLETARAHLLKVAQTMLNIQGMSKVRPRDVSLIPLRIKTALALFRDRGIHTY